MTESCSNCGAELYGGQQFCRRCGTPVGAVAGGEAPTQLFDGGAQVGAPAPVDATSPLGVGARTEGVGGQRPTEYHHGSGQQTSALVGQPYGSRPLAVGAPPAPKRRRGLWVFALLAVFVLGAGLASGAAFLWWRATHTGTVVRVVKTVPPPPPVAEVPPIPEIPEMPADIGERVKEALESLKGQGIPLPLDEAGAVVSGDATTLTRTYEIDSGSSFKAHIISGNVTVVGAEGADETVVKIVKRGGSEEQRAAARVLAAESEEGIMLVSGAPPGGPVNISYEITVPRSGLRKLELATQKGDIKVSEFDGDVELNVTNGSVTVGTSGAVRSRVTNGKTSVTYTGRHDEPQEFSVINGELEVLLPGEQEVDLKAASTNGRIEVDGALPLKAEKRGPGHRLEAELGGGGAPLNVKVINGNIRLKK